MIVNMILNVLSGFLGFILTPLSILDVGFDIANSIPVVSRFIGVIAYLFPWSNLLPLLLFTFLVLNIRNVISIIKAIWGLLPFV